jgi:hypothetical protein
MVEEVASSMPRSSNHPATGVAAMHAAQQHTHVQTSRASSRAAPGALSAARELLRNPPSSTTSPGNMRQWREDVDRLLGMAHSGSARPRPRSFRRQREASASVHSPSVRGHGLTTCEQSSTASVRARMPDLSGEGAGVPSKLRRSQPRLGLRSSFATNSKGCPNPGGCPIGRCWLRRTSGSSPRGDLATQVPTTPAREVRRYDELVEILAGLRHHHYSIWWKHCCDGKLFSCSLDRAGPDLAHEPHPRVSLLLGRALCMVHSELHQCLPAAWRGGSSPCSEAGTRGDSSGFHLPFHQGTGDYTSHL